MLNIIKMDLYKMLKSKTFYRLNIALLVITLSMALLMSFVLTRDYESGQNSGVSVQIDEDKPATNDPSITEEEYKLIQKEEKDNMNVNQFMLFQYSEPLISILMTIFIAIFICSEFDTGYIKNLVPLKNSRMSLVVSKNIVVALFVIIQSIVAFIASVGGNLIVSGKINILEPKELLAYLSFQILLRIGLGSLLILISYLFRSKSASMSIGILLSVNLHGIFLNILDKAANNLNFDLSSLSIVGNTIIGKFGSEDYKRVIILSISYFILYNIISIIRVKKLEIN